jgi:hypothetical protein
MKRLLDYDPLSRQEVWWESHGDGKTTITHTQDVQPVLDLAHGLAMDENRTSKGIKGDMWHYAKVPATVIMEMKDKHGVDFFDRNDWPRVFRLLNTEYSRFKTTQKTHEVKHG